MRISKVLVALLFASCALQLFAQKEKAVSLKNVRGEFAITDEMFGTVNPKEMARTNAKRKAIEQVCGQRVNIWDQMEVSEAGDSFNSLAIVQTDGEIVEFEVVEEGSNKSNVRSSEYIFYCVANVKVKKGLSPDPNFSAKTDGVRSVYFENDELKFIVQPLQDCFLRIFLFENAQIGYMLYPQIGEPVKKLSANQRVIFPLTDEWVITKESDKPMETNQLVLVFTKTEWAFPANETSRTEIEKWVMKIPIDQRFIDIKTMEIRNK